jgi:hypothetical protein
MMCFLLIAVAGAHLRMPPMHWDSDLCLFNYLFTYDFFSDALDDLEHRPFAPNAGIINEYLINWKHLEGSDGGLISGVSSSIGWTNRKIVSGL